MGNFELVYNKETGVWERKPEAYMTLEIATMEDFEELKAALEFYKKHKWIPVSEGLPEDDKRLKFYDDGRMRCITVLAYTEYGRIIPKNRLLVRPTGNEFLDKQVTDGWIWESGTKEVTHWMPQPEPPEEGNHDAR